MKIAASTPTKTPSSGLLMLYVPWTLQTIYLYSQSSLHKGSQKIHIMHLPIFSMVVSLELGRTTIFIIIVATQALYEPVLVR